MPMLLMLAGRDRIIANQATRDFFGRASSSNKTLIEYSNATHTLEFEPDPSRYFADLTSWIKCAVTPSPACGLAREC
jgi:alpha-beta hydrolase superfamily lysophospholipase